MEASSARETAKSASSSTTYILKFKFVQKVQKEEVFLRRGKADFNPFHVTEGSWCAKLEKKRLLMGKY